MDAVGSCVQPRTRLPVGHQTSLDGQMRKIPGVRGLALDYLRKRLTFGEHL